MKQNKPTGHVTWNLAKAHRLGVSPIATLQQDTTTFEGAAAWSRDAKSDLFLLATTNFFGEDTFYEKANDRNTRFVELVHRAAREDPAWIQAFLPWLRQEANIRTAAVVGAVEAARVLAQAGQSGSEMGPARRVLGETLYRADEPAEALAYYLKTYGRNIPAPIRRGIGDAALRLYTERSFIKWDSGRNAVRMADVIELTHPKPSTVSKLSAVFRDSQGDLFKFILDSRRRPTLVPEQLRLLARNRELLHNLSTNRAGTLSDILKRPDLLTGGGLTWEALSSSGPMNGQAWEAMIPGMGYMALLRNLRNFQDNGVSDEMLKKVALFLSDEEQVKHSRQLPFRFLSAHLEATHPVWALALEAGLQYSTQNIPSLPGRTLVLVDTSASMQTSMSPRSKVAPVVAGALFGVSLAAKGELVDLFGFADGVFQFPVRRNSGVLRSTEAFTKLVGKVGHGTQTALSLRATWSGHDRVVIVTDGQTFGSYGNVGDQVPSHVPIYAFNTSGYAPAMMELSKTRHEMGGLTDHTFKLIPMVEAGTKGLWPWEGEHGEE